MAERRTRQNNPSAPVTTPLPATLETTPLEPIKIPPKVTVILIVRNQAAELRRAIAALERSSDRESLELLVVDSGSMDDTRNVDEEYPSVMFLHLPDDFGATKALNIATRTAKTEFLFFLSPDVEVESDTIASLMERIEGEEGVAAVCPLVTDAHGTPALLIQPLPTRESLTHVCAGEAAPTVNLDLTQDSIAVAYPGRHALLIRKQFIVGMNFFDQRFGEYWADADLAFQIRRAQRKIVLYPSICCLWHRPATALTDDPAHVSDQIAGAASLLSKYEGALAGMSFRIRMLLGSLVRGDFRRFSAVLGGNKVGSHAS